MTRQEVQIAALALFAASAVEARGAPLPGRSGAAEPSGCVRSWTEARYRNYGYDQLVHLQSSCGTPRACKVSTSVNPEVIEVSVAPGKHVTVVTWVGSPVREFTARVSCSRAGR